jgi:copper chaperone CopZ
MPTIQVQGMKCPHCAGSTVKALEDIDGISNVQVDLDSGTVSYDGDAEAQIIQDAISRAGFTLVEK